MPPFRMVRPRRAWTPPKPKPPKYRGPKLLPGPPRGKRGRAATAAAAPSFNPLTGWTTDPVHGVWASDPLWTPPADGGAVSSWRNGGTVGGDLVQATGAAQPTYRASTAAYNNKPTVQFDGTDDCLAVNPADVAQAFYIVACANTGGAGSLEIVVGTGNGVQAGIGDTLANAWLLNSWAALTGGTRDSSPHLWRATVAGASSALLIDEAAVASGDAGTGAFTRFVIGAATSDGVSFFNKLTGHVAFVLVFNTDPTAQAEWASFVAMVETDYGIAVA